MGCRMNAATGLALGVVLGMAAWAGEGARARDGAGQVSDGVESGDSRSRRDRVREGGAQEGKGQPAFSTGAEAAVRVVLEGLKQDRAEVLWEALPASYKRDVNELLHLFAGRLHPEAWRWFQQIAGKGAEVARWQGRQIEQAAKGDDREAAGRWAKVIAALAGTLEQVSKAGPGVLETMQTVDVGDLLRTEGRPLIKPLRGVLEQAEYDLSKATVRLEESEADAVAAQIQFSESRRVRIDLVRVEGKWVPRVLAEHWGEAMAAANNAVREHLPSERPRDNFGRTFQVLAALDFALDGARSEARQLGADADSAFDDFPDLCSVRSCCSATTYPARRKWRPTSKRRPRRR